MQEAKKWNKFLGCNILLSSINCCKIFGEVVKTLVYFFKQRILCMSNNIEANARILIVDDTPQNTQVLGTILLKKGVVLNM